MRHDACNSHVPHCVLRLWHVVVAGFGSMTGFASRSLLRVVAACGGFSPNACHIARVGLYAPPLCGACVVARLWCGIDCDSLPAPCPQHVICCDVATDCDLLLAGNSLAGEWLRCAVLNIMRVADGGYPGIALGPIRTTVGSHRTRVDAQIIKIFSERVIRYVLTAASHLSGPF